MRRFILTACLVAPFLAAALGWWGAGAKAALLVLPPWGLYLWAKLRPRCPWWGPVLNSFATRHREALLTFDNSPHPEETPRVLNLLDEHQAKGLFFIAGDLACRHPQLVRDIAARGHGIGVQPMNVGDGAPPFWRLAPAALENEVGDSLAALRRILPQHELRWFRAPGGRRNHWADPRIQSAGLHLMGWSASDDGLKLRDFDETVIRLRHDIGLGGLVCLHHGQTDRSGSPTLLPLVEELLIWLRGQGYKLGE